MEYTLRKLQAQDLFIVTKIINCVGLKEIKNCFESENVKKMRAELSKALKSADNEGDVKRINDEYAGKVGNEVMFDITEIVLSNLDKTEDYLYKFISNLSGINDVKSLDLITFTEIVIEIFKKEEFKDFIKVVSKSFK